MYCTLCLAVVGVGFPLHKGGNIQFRYIGEDSSILGTWIFWWIFTAAGFFLHQHSFTNKLQYLEVYIPSLKQPASWHNWKICRQNPPKLGIEYFMGGK